MLSTKVFAYQNVKRLQQLALRLVSWNGKSYDLAGSWSSAIETKDSICSFNIVFSVMAEGETKVNLFPLRRSRVYLLSFSPRN